MSRSHFDHSILAGASIALVLLVLQAAIPRAFAQERESTFADSYLPLVYPVRDTGAHDQTPDFPSFSRLPIVRPLPDPFLFPDGRRDTSLWW
ncbi:MAG: hypothetical protein ACREFZ_11595 [Acetobacteraceae bacterium]